jgi:cephalosporin hydroxylase
MKRPVGFDSYFEKWISQWKPYLSEFVGIPNVIGIEIGALYGECSVFCAETIASGENSLHIVIDINTNEYLQNNIAPYKNIRFIHSN